MWTIDTSAVFGSHHHFGVRQMHGGGQVVPPREDAGWKARIAHNGAVGGVNFHADAGLAAHRVMEASVVRDRDRRAGDASLMHADVGVERFAQGFREVSAGNRQDSHAAASLGLRLDRVGTDQSELLEGPAVHRQQPTRVGEQDE